MKTKSFLLFFLCSISTAAFSQSSIPAWAKGAVWYQIVPERFRNADTRNDPVKERVVGKKVKDWQVHPWASDWYKFQIWEVQRKADFYDLVEERRYGGDLLGVIEKLRYLKALGVDVIYLTPIFESPSVMKYDAATFHHIDNNFGQDREGDWSLLATQQENPEKWETTRSDETFFSLLKYAHDVKMKVVIEAVFSYCSRDFWAFKDLLEKQQESVYKDWFEVLAWDDPVTVDTSEFQYRCWQDNANLPCFKRDEKGLVEPVKKYIFDSTRRWMDPNLDGDPLDGIDGWCITDSQGLDSKFWEEWTRSVKSINPEAITVLNPTANAGTAVHSPFDIFINYAFEKVVNAFFVYPEKVKVSEFDNRLALLREDDKGHSLLNLIGSHRSDRIGSRIRNATNLFGNGTNADTYKVYDPRKPEKSHVQIHKLIAIFQMTYPGSPMIYYGDESGMWGGPNPDNLKPMLWSEFVAEHETYWNVRRDIEAESKNVFDSSLFRLYATLNEIRHKNPAIRLGSFRTHLVDDDRSVYAYLRQLEKNEVLIVLNNNDERQTLEIESPWPEGTKIKDELNEKKYRIKNRPVKIELEKKWGAILVKSK